MRAGPGGSLPPAFLGTLLRGAFPRELHTPRTAVPLTPRPGSQEHGKDSLGGKALAPPSSSPQLPANLTLGGRHLLGRCPVRPRAHMLWGASEEQMCSCP